MGGWEQAKSGLVKKKKSDLSAYQRGGAVERRELSFQGEAPLQVS